VAATRSAKTSAPHRQSTGGKVAEQRCCAAAAPGRTVAPPVLYRRNLVGQSEATARGQCGPDGVSSNRFSRVSNHVAIDKKAPVCFSHP